MNDDEILARFGISSKLRYGLIIQSLLVLIAAGFRYGALLIIISFPTRTSGLRSLSNLLLFLISYIYRTISEN